MKTRIRIADIRYSEIGILLVASFMSFAANLPDHFLANMVDRRVLLATLTAFVVIAMFRYLRMALIVAISILAIGANLPAELASALGISQLALIAALGVLVAVSTLNYKFRLLPVEAAVEPGSPAMSSGDARSALLAAISKGDLATVNHLLRMNTEVNFYQDGTTPIHLATEKGYSEIVQALIRNGANFRLKNAAGRRPLEIALTKKYVRTTEILFAANRPYFANPELTMNLRMPAGIWSEGEEPGAGAASPA
jgi:hypothetical protein